MTSFDRRKEDVSPQERGVLRQQANTFAEAWLSNPQTPPRIDDYLVDLPTGSPLRVLLLIDLVKTDLESQWGQQEDVRVQQYFQRYPELDAEPEARSELLRWESEMIGQSIATLSCDGTSPDPSTSSRPTPLPAVPGFEVMEVLGRGGMGVVYKARHIQLARMVALKMILAGVHADEGDRVRFQIEAEAVARVLHPNIVQIFEVGEVEGRPFLALEFVGGTSLAEKINGKPQPPRQAAELVETLARAMHLAHEKNVIHRDLKPANVLLAEDGTPKITDFGLAKKIDIEHGHTQSGAVVGTPSYMAPEQATGKSKVIGPAADVYALGAILYECLTGRPPFQALTPLDTILQVVADEPVAVRLLQPKVPRDLETISMKCLQKVPGKRYACASDLAEDLRRFLAREPIQARPVGRLERGWQWCNRNAALAAALTAALLALVAGTVVSSVLAVLAKSEAGRADREASDARENERRVWEEKLVSDRRYYASEFKLASLEWQAAHLELAGPRLEALKPQGAGKADLRGIEWYYLDRLCHLDLRTFRGHTSAVLGVAFSPDGRRIASSSSDQTVRVWDLIYGHEPLTLRGHTAGVWGVAFSPDGLRLASAGGDKIVKVWDANTGHEILTVRGHTAPGKAVAFTPDGCYFASADMEGVVQIVNAATGKKVCTLCGDREEVFSIAFSPDGRRLASVGDLDGAVKLWDVLIGREISTFRREITGIKHIAFSPDGQRLAATCSDGTVKVLDAAVGKVVLTLRGHAGCAWGVAFSPDGRHMASAGWDQTVMVWDATTGQKTLTLRGHTDTVRAVAFSPDGRRVATASFDETLKVWDAVSSQETLTLAGHADLVNSVTFSPNGQHLASASRDRTVKVWKAATGEEILTLRGHTDFAHGVAFSPDGQCLACAGSDKTMRVWDVTTGREVATLRCPDSVYSLAFSPDGRRIASAGSEKVARVWDLATGRETLTLNGHTNGIHRVTFSLDCRHIATASFDNTVKVWDAETGDVIQDLRGHIDGVLSVAFSPDGNQVVSASFDRTVKVWDVSNGEETLNLRGHTGEVLDAAFSPDGRRIVTTGGDQTVRLWDAATGQEIFTLREMDRVQAVAFSPDGQRLGLAVDRTVKVWDATEWTPEVRIRREATGLIQFLFGTLLLQEEVLSAIRRDPMIGEEVRQQALSLAIHWPENPELLRQTGWFVVCKQSANREEYRRALRFLEAACRLFPDHSLYLGPLATAQYRLGQYQKALANITKAISQNSPRYYGGAKPSDLAVMAMVQQQLGHREEAKTTLVRLREMMQTMPTWRRDVESQDFLKESENLIEGNRK